MNLIRILVLLAPTALAQTATGIGALEWITGTWTGNIGRAQSEEHWIAPAGGAMLGVSRIVSGERMVAFEYLRIVQRGEEIFYIAQPQGRPPTEFKLTKSTPTSATFENPNHDHPKIITYELQADKTLIATIEGDEKGQHKKQSFHFKKIGN